MRFFKFTVFFILLSYSFNGSTQTLSNKVTISLLTCGPGNELYSVYGHTALRVHDPLTYTDVVYNYGTFDFDTPNFYLKFVKGDLQYMLSTSSYADFIETYEYFDRDVYEQVLNLTYTQKQDIANRLKETLASEKRFYMYKFIDRNCTTMAGNDTEAAIAIPISHDVADKGRTYRDILYGYQEGLFFENLGINLIFGYSTDKTLDKLFLPLQLMEGVSKTNVNGQPLALKTATIYKSTGSLDKSSLFNNFYFFAMVLLIVTAFSGKRIVQVSFLVIFGLLGIFFTTVGFYSFHAEISQNYNALLINPLYLVLLFFMVKDNTKWVIRIVYICLASILVYLLVMLNKPHLFMVLPIVVLAMVTLIRIALKYRNSVQ